MSFVDLTKNSIGVQESEVYSAFTHSGAISIAAPIIIQNISISPTSYYQQSYNAIAPLNNHNFVGFRVEGKVNSGSTFYYTINGYKDSSWTNITYLYYEGSSSRAGTVLDDVVYCPPSNLGYEQLKVIVTIGGSYADLRFSVYGLKLYSDEISFST